MSTEARGQIAYIGLGSNLAQPVEQIKAARLAIASLESVEELAFSSLYKSPPMGPPEQPDYVNAVMAIATTLSPESLLQCLQAIENSQGRVRGIRWGARTLDLDILLYDDLQIQLPYLTVPHVGIAERAFVLYPLFEIAPELTVPGLGSLAELRDKCPRDGLERIA